MRKTYLAFYVFDDHFVREHIPCTFDNTELPLFVIFTRNLPGHMCLIIAKCGNMLISVTLHLRHVRVRDINIICDQNWKSFFSERPRYRSRRILS